MVFYDPKNLLVALYRIGQVVSPEERKRYVKTESLAPGTTLAHLRSVADVDQLQWSRVYRKYATVDN